MCTVALSSGSLSGIGTGRTFDVIAAAGLDGVELVVDPEGIARGHSWLARRARDAGIRITSVHPFLYALPGPLGDASAPERLVRMAVDVGCRVVTLHPPITHDTTGDAWRTWSRSLDAARAMAERDEVALSVENPPVFRPADRKKVLVRVSDLLAFCQAQGLRVTYDTAHAWSAGEDVVAACAAVASRLANLHLSDVRQPRAALDRPPLDSFFKHHQVPGDGALPLAEVLGAVKAAGYRGPVTLELSPFAVGWPRLRRIRARLGVAATWVRRHWDDVQPRVPEV